MDLHQTSSFSWKSLTKNLFEEENKKRKLAYEKELNRIHILNKYFALKDELFFTKPVLGLVIDRLGDDPTVLEKVIKLPPEVGLGFSVFSIHLKDDIAQAKKYGHDVFIDIPMKSFQYEMNFYGDIFLEPFDEIEESKEKIDQLLSHLPAVNGVINEGGDFSLQNKEFVECFVSLVEKKHLIYLSRPTISNTKNTIEKIYPYLLDYAFNGNKSIIATDIVFSSESGKKDILNEKIQALLKNLQRKKFSVVIVDPYPYLITWINEFIKNIKNEKLIKISELIKDLYVQLNNEKYDNKSNKGQQNVNLK